MDKRVLDGGPKAKFLERSMLVAMMDMLLCCKVLLSFFRSIVMSLSSSSPELTQVEFGPKMLLPSFDELDEEPQLHDHIFLLMHGIYARLWEGSLPMTSSHAQALKSGGHVAVTVDGRKDAPTLHESSNYSCSQHLPIRTISSFIGFLSRRTQ